MILGMSLSTFTTFHVILSLVGIATGFAWLASVLRSRQSGAWTAWFLSTTVLTSATGFLFPLEKLLPSHVFGVVSLVLLAVTLIALYRHRLAGSWRWLYLVTGIAALYLNVFVGVVQAFLKLSFLQPLAPTQSEPPFFVAQAIVLAAFVALGVLALRGFHPDPASAALRHVDALNPLR
jgi:hypothetical protein